MNFDRLAPHYDWMEAITAGKRLQRVRTQWLGALTDRRRLLSAGESHGGFASACALRHPRLDITCIDASAGMLARARRRTVTCANSIRWEIADVLSWIPSGEFEAIATYFFLDCFPREMQRRVIGRLAQCAAHVAVWIVADFAVPPRGVARWRTRFVHAIMYAFFRVTVSLPAARLVSPDDLLTAHGFSLAGRREFEWGMLRADVAAVLIATSSSGKPTSARRVLSSSAPRRPAPRSSNRAAVH